MQTTSLSMKEGFFYRVQEMELLRDNSTSNILNMAEPEIEVEIKDDQEVIAAEENSIFHDPTLELVDNPEYQGILNQQGDKNLEVSFNDLGVDVAFWNHESHQNPRHLQLEGLDTLDARVQQPQVLAAEENSVLLEHALSFLDNPEHHGILNQQGDKNLEVSLNDLGGDVTFSNQESHQSPRHLQLEGLETIVARVPKPQPQRTRPRIRRGLTPWQQGTLEQAFQEVQYPNEITKKILARQLYMGQSEVHRWFKMRRAKYRKIQRLQKLKSAPNGTQISID